METLGNSKTLVDSIDGTPSTRQEFAALLPPNA